MEKTKKQMRAKINELFSRIPNRDYDKCHIMSVGRDYIHFISLYEGSKPEKVQIKSFYETRDLHADKY